MPKGIRWARAVLVLAVVIAGTAIYLYKEWRQTEALRADILRAYQRTARAYRGPIGRLDGKIAAKVREAGGRYAGDFRDPIFRVDALQKGTGFYLRLPRAGARSEEAIRRAARRQHSDAVPGCLAVGPALYGRLLVLGDLVGEDFRAKLLDASNVARLRALDQDFVLRARRDLPRLVEMLRPDWLMAILDEPAGAHQAHIWDLHSGRELLRVRTGGPATDVVNVRWSGQGTVPSKRPSDRSVLNTADDCAIADAIRQTAGEPPRTTIAPR